MHPSLCITPFAKFVAAVPLLVVWERNHETVSGGATLTRSKGGMSFSATTTNMFDRNLPVPMHGRPRWPALVSTVATC